MQATCSNCGARYNLKDAQIGSHPVVQFRCAECGRTTVLRVGRRAERTAAVSPLPSFARGGGGSGDATAFISEFQDLSLPEDKVITLAVMDGPAKGKAYPVEKSRVILGREDADITINDPEISRRHCAVEVKGEVVRLRDLDSTNGTFVDEERVRAAELSHLAEFRIGTTVVQIQIAPKQS